MHDAGIGARPLNRTRRRPGTPSSSRRCSSPPLSVMLQLMDVPSDDLFAEMLAKQLGVRFGGGGSIAAGAQVISQHDRPRTACIRRSSTARGCRARTAPRRARSSTCSGHLEHAEGACCRRRCRWSASAAPSKASAQRPPPRGTASPRPARSTTSPTSPATATAQDGHELAFALMIDGPGNWTAIQLFEPDGRGDRQVLKPLRPRPGIATIVPWR